MWGGGEGAAGGEGEGEGSCGVAGGAGDEAT